eukprot:2412152-Rhodomonas_salina.2
MRQGTGTRDESRDGRYGDGEDGGEEVEAAVGRAPDRARHVRQRRTDHRLLPPTPPVRTPLCVQAAGNPRVARSLSLSLSPSSSPSLSHDTHANTNTNRDRERASERAKASERERRGGESQSLDRHQPLDQGAEGRKEQCVGEEDTPVREGLIKRWGGGWHQGEKEVEGLDGDDSGGVGRLHTPRAHSASGATKIGVSEWRRGCRTDGRTERSR